MPWLFITWRSRFPNFWILQHNVIEITSMKDQCGHKWEGDDEPGHSSIDIKTNSWILWSELCCLQTLTLCFLNQCRASPTVLFIRQQRSLVRFYRRRALDKMQKIFWPVSVEVPSSRPEYDVTHDWVWRHTWLIMTSHMTEYDITHDWVWRHT